MGCSGVPSLLLRFGIIENLHYLMEVEEGDKLKMMDFQDSHYLSDEVRAFVTKHADDVSAFRRKVEDDEFIIWNFAGRINFTTFAPIKSKEHFVDEVMAAYHSDERLRYEMQAEMKLLLS